MQTTEHPTSESAAPVEQHEPSSGSVAAPRRPEHRHLAAVEATPSAGPAMASASDLADVMAAFTAATERLQQAHTALEAEVARLKGELRETNAKLRRSRELAALGQMAAAIAHEVRNPLGSIRLYASMILEDLEASLPESSRLAGRIVQAVDDLDSFVSDVLSYSKELKVRRVQVDPVRILREAARTCEPLCNGKTVLTIEPNVILDGTVPACEIEAFSADPVLLQQALVNLIRNALEASSETGGSVCGRVLVHRTPAANWISDSASDGTRLSDAWTAPCRAEDVATVTFEVVDSGPGLSEDSIESMYNPFFTTKPSGTGLGLSIAHKIVEAHGGELEIVNNDGPGVTARLRLRADSATCAVSGEASRTLVR